MKNRVIHEINEGFHKVFQDTLVASFNLTSL